MLTSLSLDNAKGEAVVLHEVSGTAKRALISVKGLVGIGALRQSKRVRPSAHGGINETRFEDGGTITLEGEIVGATYAEAEEQFSAVSQVMLETLDSGPALMKYETSGGRTLQMRVKLDSDIEPVLSGVAPRYVYQCSFFAEDPRSYTQAATTLTGAGITGTAQEATWLQTSLIYRPSHVCVDAGHIYWTYNGQHNAIGRAAIGGGTIENEWIKTTGAPTALAISATNVYWGWHKESANLMNIGRATIAGAEVNNTWNIGTISTTQPITAMVVSPANTFLYYSWGSNIGRYKIGAENPEETWMTLGYAANALAVDATYLYWGGPGGVGRSTTAGAEINSFFITEIGPVYGLFVNASNIYWTAVGRAIGRAKLNGTEPLYFFIPGIGPEPRGLAGNTEHLYWGESTGYIARSKELANGGPIGSACKVEQEGNRPSPLIFKINGPVTNPAVLRKSTGARIALYGTIATGNYAEINTAKRTVLLNGTGNLLSYLDAQNTNWGAFEAPNSPAAETYELAATSATAAKLEAIFRGAYA